MSRIFKLYNDLNKVLSQKHTFSYVLYKQLKCLQSLLTRVRVRFVKLWFSYTQQSSTHKFIYEIYSYINRRKGRSADPPYNELNARLFLISCNLGIQHSVNAFSLNLKKFYIFSFYSIFSSPGLQIL